MLHIALELPFAIYASLSMVDSGKVSVGGSPQSKERAHDGEPVNEMEKQNRKI